VALFAIHLVAVLICFFAASPARADDRTAASTVIELQTRVVESTQAYKGTLERLVSLQEEAAERAGARARQLRQFLESGIVSRREVEEAEGRWRSAVAKAEESRQHVAEADALIGEALAAIEIAKMPPPRPQEPVVTATVIREPGDPGFVGVDVGGIEHFFLEQFAKPLPVSARGQTAVHDRLGLDHRHALDVAVHPDSEEGKRLIDYLRRHHIPFLAFRRPIPGSSTGAHLHIGLPSPPLAAVKATGR
jgi:hypothetical protein